jgi:hypothetical protein
MIRLCSLTKNNERERQSQDRRSLHALAVFHGTDSFNVRTQVGVS